MEMKEREAREIFETNIQLAKQFKSIIKDWNYIKMFMIYMVVIVSILFMRVMGLI